MLLTTWTVDSLGDGTAADAGITLREALEAANQNIQVGDAQPGSATEADRIRFAPALFAGGPARITLSGTQLTISDDAQITGPGADQLTIDANQQSRVLNVSSDVNATLSGLTISGGTTDAGGGIYNGGTLTVTNSAISGNSATGDGEHAGGGGIDNSGTLTVTNSTISGNSAAAEHADGGGIHNDGGTLTVTSSTISGNSATGNYGDGGGIDNSGTLTVTDSTISGNSADDDGGGIDNDEDGTLTVTNSTISSNSAGDDGGGIQNWQEGTLIVTNSTILGNSANYGGGIGNSGTLTVTDSTISGNSADDDGGGIDNDEDGTLTVTGSTISGNSADDGGGIFNKGTLTVTGSTISGNKATGSFTRGGGIHNFGTLTVTSSTILGNSADYGGGIDNDEYGTLTVTNSTISGNSATGNYGNGGGIGNDQDGTLTVTDSTISGNSAMGEYSRSGGIYNYGTLTVTNSIVALNRATSDSDVHGRLAPQSGFNLIGVDPLFVRAPSAGADGVWGTEDDDYGDLHLSDHSPAINLGNGAMLPEGLTTDRDGNPRILGEHVDIGAYEFQGDPAPGREAPSTVLSTTDDSVDVYDGRISLREAIFYAAPGETITFEGDLGGQEIILGGAPVVLDDPLTIDASALESLAINGNQKSRVLTALANGVELIGLTITGGSSAGDGGGMANFGTLTVTGSTISGNSADGGGGIHSDDGTLTVTGSTISGNSATGFSASGGGIDNRDGSVTVTNSTISDNSATGHYGDGGGIDNRYGSVTVTNSTISGNSATGSGADGGGIHSYDGTLTVTNSTISGNSASDDGGGIYNFDTLTVTNSTISGNSAGDTGGGIYNFGRWGGALTLTNSIVALNHATSDSDVYGPLTAQSRFNVIGGDPRFVRNAEPQNGDFGDFRLRPDSPAIDAGSTAAAVGPDGSSLVFDIRGEGFPRVRGAAVDIGAFEYQPPRDLDGSGRIDDGDLNLLLSSLGAAGGPADLTDDGVVDQHDVSILLLRFGDPLGQGLSAQSGERKAERGERKAESGRAYATLLPLPVYGPVEYRSFRAARRGTGILPVCGRSTGQRPAPQAERLLETLTRDVARRRRLRRVTRRGAPAARPDAAAVDAALADWGTDHLRRPRGWLDGADFD